MVLRGEASFNRINGRIFRLRQNKDHNVRSLMEINKFNELFSIMTLILIIVYLHLLLCKSIVVHNSKRTDCTYILHTIHSLVQLVEQAFPLPKPLHTLQH